jgi:hypothetical protein
MIMVTSKPLSAWLRSCSIPRGLVCGELLGCILKCVNYVVSPGLSQQPDTTPRNVTWNFGVVRELRKNLHLDVSYLNSRTSYLFVVEPFTAASPTGASYMGLTNTGSSKYHEVEASVHYTFRDSDQLKASYIWSHARGDLNNLSSVMIPFAAPVFRPDVYGILASDIPNRFVAWGIFTLPWKITFSPLVDVHSGFPWSPIDVTQQYVGTPNGQRFRRIPHSTSRLIGRFGYHSGKARTGKIITSGLGTTR